MAATPLYRAGDSAQSVRSLMAEAVGLSNLQRWLDTACRTRAQKLAWIGDWRSAGTVSDEEADLLTEHNGWSA